MDGLTTNGVLVMHPQGFPEESKQGMWREISVCGNVYTLRETRSGPIRGQLVSNITNHLLPSLPQQATEEAVNFFQVHKEQYILWLQVFCLHQQQSQMKLKTHCLVYTCFGYHWYQNRATEELTKSKFRHMYSKSKCDAQYQNGAAINLFVCLFALVAFLWGTVHDTDINLWCLAGRVRLALTNRQGGNIQGAICLSKTNICCSNKVHKKSIILKYVVTVYQ